MLAAPLVARSLVLPLVSPLVPPLVARSLAVLEVVLITHPGRRMRHFYKGYTSLSFIIMSNNSSVSSETAASSTSSPMSVAKSLSYMPLDSVGLR